VLELGDTTKGQNHW